MEAENIRVSDVIEKIGKELHPNFSLKITPQMMGNYKGVYDVLYASLKQEKKKGFLTLGTVGSGKSLAVKIMQKLFLGTEREFVRKKAIDINNMLDYYKISEILEMYGDGLNKDLYLDDLGFGNVIRASYSNKYNVVAELINARYELFLERGYLTHFSSNALMESKDDKVLNIKSLYGDRVFDRIYEMSEVVIWKGETLR